MKMHDCFNDQTVSLNLAFKEAINNSRKLDESNVDQADIKTKVKKSKNSSVLSSQSSGSASPSSSPKQLTYKLADGAEYYADQQSKVFMYPSEIGVPFQQAQFYDNQAEENNESSLAFGNQYAMSHYPQSGVFAPESYYQTGYQMSQYQTFNSNQSYLNTAELSSASYPSYAPSQTNTSYFMNEWYLQQHMDQTRPSIQPDPGQQSIRLDGESSFTNFYPTTVNQSNRTPLVNYT